MGYSPRSMMSLDSKRLDFACFSNHNLLFKEN